MHSLILFCESTSDHDEHDIGVTYCNLTIAWLVG